MSKKKMIVSVATVILTLFIQIASVAESTFGPVNSDIEAILKNRLQIYEPSNEELDRMFDEAAYEDKGKYGNAKLYYRIYSPQDDGKNEKYPLVVFLNGVGTAGTDNKKQIYNEHLPKLLLSGDYPKKYPCIILAPQPMENSEWVENFNGGMSTSMSMLMDAMDGIIKQYKVDKDRIYISGISSGGGGTWDALTRFPDLFAAGAPMCGYSMVSKAEAMKDIPIWAFHSAHDQNVPSSNSRNMVEALRKLGNDVRYSEYDSYYHSDAWLGAYYDQDFLPWLFSQSKAKPVNPDKEDPGDIDTSNVGDNSAGNSGSDNSNVGGENDWNSENSGNVSEVLRDTDSKPSDFRTGPAGLLADSPSSHILFILITLSISIMVIFMGVAVWLRKRNKKLESGELDAKVSRNKRGK